MITTPRIEIKEGTTEFNILFTILRENSGAKRNALLHAYFTAIINGLVRTIAPEGELMEEYYKHIQDAGGALNCYQTVFVANEHDHPVRGLDLIREFNAILTIENATQKLCKVFGVEGFDITPKYTLDASYLDDINYLGFDVKIVRWK